jgi:hypothetical protein
MAQWSFGQVQDGVVTGFRHSGIDIFRGHRLDRMVRECIQNALDARDGEAQGPVRVALTLDDFDPRSHGILSGLEDYMHLGLAQSTAPNSVEAEWYQAALNTISSASVPVLGVHDGNTIGLQGTTDKFANQKSRWLALVAGQGINLGQHVDGLGGFGHGSNAAFAMSRLRTAFYLSSTTDEHDEAVTRFQGHCLLQTLFLPGREQTVPDGFFGQLDEENINKPLIGEGIPSQFLNIRSKAVGEGRGTSVFICDPIIQGNPWDEIVVSVVANFALAIKFGHLSVKLGDGTSIDQASLMEAYLRVQELVDGADGADGSDGLNVSDATLKNLTSVKTVLYPNFSSDLTPLAVEHFGQFHWFLRVGNDVGSRGVAVAREPGMVITYQAPSLSGRSFSKYRDFDLVVCVRTGTPGRSGAHVIKQMEDPTHTDLSWDWVDEGKTSEVKKKYKRFVNAVKSEVLDKHAQIEVGESEAIEIEGLLIPAMVGEEDYRDSMSDVEITRGKVARRTPAWPKPKVGMDGPGMGSPPPGEGGQGGPGGTGGNPPPAETGFDIEGVRYERAQIARLQIVPTKDNSHGFVRVKVIGRQTFHGPSRIALFVSGESQTQGLEMRNDPSVPLDVADRGTVAFGNGTTASNQISVWIPESAMNKAFGGEVYRGL